MHSIIPISFSHREHAHSNNSLSRQLSSHQSDFLPLSLSVHVLCSCFDSTPRFDFTPPLNSEAFNECQPGYSFLALCSSFRACVGNQLSSLLSTLGSSLFGGHADRMGDPTWMDRKSFVFLVWDHMFQRQTSRTCSTTEVFAQPPQLNSGSTHSHYMSRSMTDAEKMMRFFIYM